MLDAIRHTAFVSYCPGEPTHPRLRVLNRCLRMPDCRSGRRQSICKDARQRDHRTHDSSIISPRSAIVGGEGEGNKGDKGRRERRRTLQHRTAARTNIGSGGRLRIQMVCRIALDGEPEKNTVGARHWHPNHCATHPHELSEILRLGSLVHVDDH